MTIRFAGCSLDLAARRIFRGGREIHMSPKAFGVLRALIEARPRALSKPELLESVWPRVFVSDASLAKAVSEIRHLTGGGGRNGQIVRTVHGYGYAFVASIVDEEAKIRRSDAAVRVVHLLRCGKRDFPLPEGQHIIGREPDVLVSLDSPKVSRRHAQVTLQEDQVTLEDIGSKNGTFVGGVRISELTALRPGDQIDIGPFTLVLRRLSETAPTETDLSHTPPSWTPRRPIKRLSTRASSR
jgi:DNA-binding winged helix-turn-helix (wHTH) protein